MLQHLHSQPSTPRQHPSPMSQKGCVCTGGADGVGCLASHSRSQFEASWSGVVLDRSQTGRRQIGSGSSTKPSSQFSGSTLAV
eukprot:2554609-Rhodomonas_salina.1